MPEEQEQTEVTHRHEHVYPPATEGYGLFGWVKDNPIFVTGLIVNLVMLGVMWGTLLVQNGYRDDRIKELLSSDQRQDAGMVDLMAKWQGNHYQIDANTAAIAQLRADERQTEMSVSEIKAKIDVLSVKMDSLKTTTEDTNAILRNLRLPIKGNP